MAVPRRSTRKNIGIPPTRYSDEINESQRKVECLEEEIRLLKQASHSEYGFRGFSDRDTSDDETIIHRVSDDTRKFDDASFGMIRDNSQSKDTNRVNTMNESCSFFSTNAYDSNDEINANKVPPSSEIELMTTRNSRRQINVNEDDRSNVPLNQNGNSVLRADTNDTNAGLRRQVNSDVKRHANDNVPVDTNRRKIISSYQENVYVRDRTGQHKQAHKVQFVEQRVIGNVTSNLQANNTNFHDEPRQSSRSDTQQNDGDLIRAMQQRIFSLEKQLKEFSIDENNQQFESDDRRKFDYTNLPKQTYNERRAFDYTDLPQQPYNDRQNSEYTNFPHQSYNNRNSNANDWRNSDDRRRQNYHQPRNDDAMTMFMARQSLGKDLPNFSGNPEEWQLFHSQYVRSTELCGFSSAENVARLQKCLKGDALESVRALLVSPRNADEIIEILHRRYGRPEYIIKSMIRKIKLIPAVKEDRPQTIVNFATAVRNLAVTLRDMNRIEYIRNPQLMEDLENKLPPVLHIMWSDAIFDRPNYDLIDFSLWLDKKSYAASLRIVPEWVPTNELKATKPKKMNASINTGTEVQNEKESKKIANPHMQERDKVICQICGGGCQHVDKCEKMMQLNVDDRWKIATENGLCFSCLRSGHSTYKCKTKKKCSVGDCTRKHHSLLHKQKFDVADNTTAKPFIESCTQATSNLNDVSTKLRIVPVNLYGENVQLKTFALLDPGSTSTLLSSSLASKLNVSGKVQPLCIQWANGQMSTDESSQSIKLEISGVFDGAKSYVLNNVRTVTDLTLPTQTIDKSKLIAKWPFLGGIDFDGYRDATPTLLIGENNALVMATKQLIHDVWNAPIASKTSLGWVISGNDGSVKQDKLHSTILHVYENNDNQLHELVKSSFKLDDLCSTNDTMRSREDDRALRIMAKTTKETDNHWQIGLLWRNENVKLPESKKNALHRLYGLEKRLAKDDVLRVAYRKIIDDYLQKGYLRKAIDPLQQNDHTWYLPHFPVINLLKPNKVRIVFDAAAKVGDVCLNDTLMQGPDLLKSLSSILFKFRQGKIAFTADIREMFHRIKIREQDISSQRILWRTDDRKAPEVFEMTVMTFGATCSPSCAIYVKDQNAIKYEREHPEAVNAILNNHYMDDYLGSADDETAAQKVVTDVITIHRNGGFEIREWKSSSPAVLNCVPLELRCEKQSNVLMNGVKDSLAHRVLGILWNPVDDVFSFSLDFAKINGALTTGEKRPTKREVLRIVMSIYDPLGFLSQFLIIGRILLQSMWKSSVGWDDPISDETFVKWQNWLRDMDAVRELKIDRCYSPSLSNATNVQLHVFADASEEAYAAVAYIRIESANEICVSLVASRAKVAPLKPMTIPRLELQAALIASRLSKAVIAGHDIKFSNVHFWTDSMTVLYWVKSEAKRYKQFVAQRLGEISELTNIDDWHWLPTDLNVADDATRSKQRNDVSNNSRWFTGPTFLREPEMLWPSRQSVQNPVSDEVYEFAGAIVISPEIALPNVNRFSSWQKLIRSTAWIRRYVNNCRNLGQHGELTVSEFETAEILWIKFAQHKSFGDDIANLMKSGRVSKSSKIYGLSPFIDENGLIRMSGRINEMNNADLWSKNPAILDAKSIYGKLLVKFYHDKANHIGHEMVLNEIRQRYWLIGARSVLKRVRNECNMCKVRNAKPTSTVMGQLPAARLTPRLPAFTFTGVDYFGPMMVKVGRRREKRYGVLFTCMVVRAVHVEVASSLTTDSCIMALRRFISRRGCPKEIYSDNGTNFKGAERELQECYVKLDHNKIRGEMTSHRIKWSFIPPASPHMGGCWERMVRSVKTALSATLNEVAPTDEVLLTLLAEVEHVTNSRPLIEVSQHPDEPEALTPNHFLIGRSSASAPFDQFSDTDLILRRDWRISQRLADLFWSRWLREFLPKLKKRSKWYESGQQLKVGDIVFIADGNEPRGIWPKGVIVAVYPGKDNIVRVADVRTSKGVYRRPLTKLCVLDIESNGTSTNTGRENVTKTH